MLIKFYWGILFYLNFVQVLYSVLIVNGFAICLFIYYIHIFIVCTKLLSTFVNRIFTLYIHDVENDIKLRMYMLCIIYTLCKSCCCKVLLTLNFSRYLEMCGKKGRCS